MRIDSKIRLLPKENNIVVEIVSDEQMKQRDSGIVLPGRQSAPHVPRCGVVLAVGPGPTGQDGKPHRPCIVQVGEKVLIPRDIGNEIITPSATVVIMPDHMVMAAYEETDGEKAPHGDTDTDYRALQRPLPD